MVEDVNPWSYDGWSKTAQGAYIQLKGMARAEARARDAGTTVSGPRPSGKKPDVVQQYILQKGGGTGSGTPGAPGAKGDKGDAGTPATQYPPAQDGEDGPPGPPGIGAPGNDGAAGAAGPPGRDGEDADIQWLFPNGAACPQLPFNDPNFFWNGAKPQLGIGTSAPAASAILDLTSTSAGFLVPRMTTTQRDAISSPANGLLIFNTTTGEFNSFEGVNGVWLGGVGGLLSGVNRQTASYTAAIVDANGVVEMNVASANNFTVPPHASVAFPAKTVIRVVQYGAGQTTIVAGSGVTLLSSGSKLKIAGQYLGATLYQTGTSNEWVVQGDLSA